MGVYGAVSKKNVHVRGHFFLARYQSAGYTDLSALVLRGGDTIKLNFQAIAGRDLWEVWLSSATARALAHHVSKGQKSLQGDFIGVIWDPF